MSIHLLAIATNYEGESCRLPDCELDALNVASAFEPFVSSAKCVLASAATRRGTLSAVRKFLDALRKGDLGLLYYSGRGTTDTVGGKELQATVCHDLRLIYETEWRAELMRRERGTMLAMLCDCCYSGGLMRGKKQARTVQVGHVFRHDVALPTREQKRPNAIYTACRAGEVAFSTGEGGAMTNAFLEEFERRHTNTSLLSLHKRVQKHLPNKEYPQHPMFAADHSMRTRSLKSFA